MKTTLHNIQALRFFAAMMVLVGHLQHEVPSVRGLDAAHYVPWTPIWFAGGVDVFFVISGFIMYLIAAESFGAPHAARDFVKRRLVRIVPPYWFFTTAMVIAMIVAGGHIAHGIISPTHVIASYLFLPWVNPYDRFYPVLMLGWTLNFEMLFYCIFAIALNFPRRLGLLFIGTVIGGLALSGALIDFRGIALANFPIAIWPIAFWSNPIVMEFLFGIALAHVFGTGVRWTRTTGLAVIALGGGAMVAAQYLGVAGQYWSARCLWMGLPALMVCSGAALMEVSAQPGPVQRAFALGGDASYLLYLSHPFSLAVVAVIWPLLGITRPLIYVMGAGTIALACAVVLHLYFEKPVMAHLTRRLFSSDKARITSTVDVDPVPLSPVVAPCRAASGRRDLRRT